MVALVRRLAAASLFPVILFPCAAFSQPVELSVWTQLTTASQSEVIERHVNECLADMPDVSANFETVSIGSMYQRVITAFQGGKLPNVMNTIEGMVGFLEAKNGLVPLDDVIDELGRDDFRPAYLKRGCEGRSGLGYSRLGTSSVCLVPNGPVRGSGTGCPRDMGRTHECCNGA